MPDTEKPGLYSNPTPQPPAAVKNELFYLNSLKTAKISPKIDNAFYEELGG